MTGAQLASVPVGTQPEEDELLACLECGRWFRGLGNHVANAHDLPAVEYRRRHELPRGQSLWAAEAREAAGVRARQRVGRYPKATATQLRGTSEEAERAMAAQRESWQRLGTRALKRENWTRQAAETRQRTRRRYDELARTAGYAGVDDVIDQTRNESATALAKILGVSASGAKWLRRYHAAGFNLDHHPPAPGPATPDELAAILSGTQPVTNTHILCRICGQWFKGLSRHLIAKHQIDTIGYRGMFEIAPDLTLMAMDAADANTRGHHEHLRHQAEQHGYPSFTDLIEQTRELPATEVARMLDLNVATVYKYRRRHG